MFHVEQWQGKVRGFFLLCKEGSEETPNKNRHGPKTMPVWGKMGDGNGDVKMGGVRTGVAGGFGGNPPTVRPSRIPRRGQGARPAAPTGRDVSHGGLYRRGGWFLGDPPYGSHGKGVPVPPCTAWYLPSGNAKPTGYMFGISLPTFFVKKVGLCKERTETFTKAGRRNRRCWRGQRPERRLLQPQGPGQGWQPGRQLPQGQGTAHRV